ncbi:branched chain amino acid ABC transporter substrate-binding protein [Pseudomonas solani]|uniref:Branched-chain amino acid ABC transporter substrate-binding protein n=1 Tax=Pseudomonas solani TaxID=2731552 RepID=A0AAU7Y004_9PSED|nr:MULTISPECIES: branched-chain amino acid ABC transporter substrate-binding protein [Pseudomonas]MCU9951241.1 branched-chain amino acid ABC transporter substrate-binding protein [Pseudomonas sp. PDM13]MDN4144281.1 branched-chain amino acid ABC transporter substrate-binding protein [Pseudomonas tohonis]WCD79854.1 branched-chain amino acid ABC transporter substrate-binding protein [Pseudomonas sp. TUM22785]BCD85018.1 branched chain amino acid ABC transporter substrate-binding protein [Pseudomona
MPHKTFKKGILAVAVTSVLSLSNLAFADVVIGVAGPHTGANASFGEQYWRGASQAAEDINAAGGVNGEKIKLVKADDACEPKQAVAVANRLVDQDKAIGVVGHFCSSSTIPASEIYDEAGIIAITPGSTNPQVTERGLTGMFRMCGRDDQQGIVAGDYIVDVLKAKKVAIIHDKDTYGQGLADATKAQLAKRGVKEVLYEGLTRGEKDFNALVTKIRATGAEVVYFGGLHPEAGPLVRQMREQGLTAKFLSGDGIVTDELVTTAGGPQYTKGVLMTFGADPRKIADGKAVIEKFRAGGFEPEGYTLYAYASLQALAAAFNGAGANEGAKASEWLKANPVQTVMGKKEWDGKGDLKVSDYVIYEWDEQGKYHQQ